MVKKSYEGELTALQAAVKRETMKVDSMEKTIEQKVMGVTAYSNRARCICFCWRRLDVKSAICFSPARLYIISLIATQSFLGSCFLVYLFVVCLSRLSSTSLGLILCLFWFA